MDDAPAPDLDLRNTRGRLKKVGIAAAISAVFTFFTMRAILASDTPNGDPVGASSVPLLAIAIFVVIALFSHAILSRKPPKPVGLRRG